jgi:hypothetical protein
MLAVASCKVFSTAQGISHFEGPIDITGTGSASAPALYFAGDSDSGLYRSAANNLDATTGGTRRVNISSSAFVLYADGTGTATFVGADAAGAANTTLDTTGAGTITIGSGDVTGVTVTSDGTGDAELTVPENSIGPDEVAVMSDVVILCGQAAENGTIYYGPATAVFGGDGSASYAISSAACDGLDNATEATADAPIFTDIAFKVTGLYCAQSGTLAAGEGVTFTVRSAAADTTPAITCDIQAGGKECRSLTGSTTDIAAGATIAIKAVQASDNTDDDHWCKLYIAYK